MLSNTALSNESRSESQVVEWQLKWIFPILLMGRIPGDVPVRKNDWKLWRSDLCMDSSLTGIRFSWQISIMICRVIPGSTCFLGGVIMLPFFNPKIFDRLPSSKNPSGEIRMTSYMFFSRMILSAFCLTSRFQLLIFGFCRSIPARSTTTPFRYCSALGYLWGIIPIKEYPSLMEIWILRLPDLIFSLLISLKMPWINSAWVKSIGRSVIFAAFHNLSRCSLINTGLPSITRITSYIHPPGMVCG